MKQITVLMSGGIDSFVSALILKRKRYHVSGLHFVVNSKELQLHIGNKKTINEISKILQIDIEIIDITKEFVSNVFEKTIDTYKKGITPNPCIICNQTIKFGHFIKNVPHKQIATGHYVKLLKENNEIKLLAPRDKLKDQRYFLYRVSPSILQNCNFPLGITKKSEVVNLANTRAPQLFSTDTYKASSDLCFLAHTHINKFLAKFIKSRPGKIIDLDSKRILGKHTGLWKFTEGQRKGIQIGGVGPFFVHSKNIANDILYVTQHITKVKNCLIRFTKPKFLLKTYSHTKAFACNIQTRYGAPKVQARINVNKCTIKTNQPTIASPGQSVVFYTKDDILIGGGIIVS